MAFGFSNIVGNMITGRLAHDHSLKIMLIGLTVLSISLFAFAIFAEYKTIAIIAIILIGLSGVPMNPAMMARIVSVAHPGPMVNAVHTSVINIGLGGGKSYRWFSEYKWLWLTFRLMDWCSIGNIGIGFTSALRT